MTFESWIEVRENRELCDMAGDIAADALAGYFEARDAVPPMDSMQARNVAAEIAYAHRRGWEFDTSEPDDPAGDLAKRVLASVRYRVRSGHIGFDAILQPSE